MKKPEFPPNIIEPHTGSALIWVAAVAGGLTISVLAFRAVETWRVLFGS